MSAIGSTPDASAILLGDGFGGGHHPRRGWTGRGDPHQPIGGDIGTDRVRPAGVGHGAPDRRRAPPEGARLGDDGTRLVQILRDVALIGGHEFVEAAVVGPRGTVTVLGAGGG